MSRDILPIFTVIAFVLFLAIGTFTKESVKL